MKTNKFTPWSNLIKSTNYTFFKTNSSYLSCVQPLSTAALAWKKGKSDAGPENASNFDSRWLS